MIENPLAKYEDSVSVTADGVKTYKALLNELYALIDIAKLSPKSTFDTVRGANYFLSYQIAYVDSTQFEFSSSNVSSPNQYTINLVTINSNNSSFIIHTNGTNTDNSSGVPTSGWKLKITY